MMQCRWEISVTIMVYSKLLKLTLVNVLFFVLINYIASSNNVFFTVSPLLITCSSDCLCPFYL